jgi:hypothetical protein
MITRDVTDNLLTTLQSKGTKAFDRQLKSYMRDTGIDPPPDDDKDDKDDRDDLPVITGEVAQPGVARGEEMYGVSSAIGRPGAVRGETVRVLPQPVTGEVAQPGAVRGEEMYGVSSAIGRPGAARGETVRVLSQPGAARGEEMRASPEYPEEDVVRRGWLGPPEMTLEDISDFADDPTTWTPSQSTELREPEDEWFSEMLADIARGETVRVPPEYPKEDVVRRGWLRPPEMTLEDISDFADDPTTWTPSLTEMLEDIAPVPQPRGVERPSKREREPGLVMVKKPPAPVPAKDVLARIERENVPRPSPKLTKSMKQLLRQIGTKATKPPAKRGQPRRQAGPRQAAIPADLEPVIAAGYV